MYERYFGLKGIPFRPLADSQFYYPSTTHEEALALVGQAIQEDEGLALLSGAAGTGKTLLGHCLVDRLDSNTSVAFVINAHVPDVASLLQALLYDLSLPHQGMAEQSLRLALTDHLIENFRGGKRNLFVIDEAQALSIEVLEELRMLCNLEGPSGRAVQTLLLGNPSMGHRLEDPRLLSFAQRLAVKARLEPLDTHEAADYLAHHLRCVGGSLERVISEESLKMLINGAGGIPRLLNRAMHRAMVMACTTQTEQVDAEIVLETLAVLGLTPADAEPAADLKEGVQLHDAVAMPDECCDAIEPAEKQAGAHVQDSATETRVPAGSGRFRRIMGTPRRPA